MLLKAKFASKVRSIGFISIHSTLFSFLGKAYLATFSLWEEGEVDPLGAFLFQGVDDFLHRGDFD